MLLTNEASKNYLCEKPLILTRKEILFLIKIQELFGKQPFFLGELPKFKGESIKIRKAVAFPTQKSIIWLI
jgi:hypothetical protein